MKSIHTYVGKFVIYLNTRLVSTYIHFYDDKTYYKISQQITKV